MAVGYQGGAATSTFDGPWSTPLEWSGVGPHPLAEFFRGCTYDEIYRRQPAVRKVIDRRSVLQSLVPLKVFQSTPDGRVEAPTSAYGRLLDDPCPAMSQFEWLDWFRHTKDIHGTAFGAISRDAGGRPVGIDPVHPLRMRHGKDKGFAVGGVNRGRLTAAERESGLTWWFVVGPSKEVHFPRRDLLIWRTYNPDSTDWGLSKLESLRGTLEDDAAARHAMEQMWKRGARPHFALLTDDDMSAHPAVVQQVKEDAEAATGGTANWWRPLVLDGGMKLETLEFEKGLEYLGLRKVTDEEVGGVYDLSGAANHNHENSTYTNAREVLQDAFRTSMASEVRSFEAALAKDVRDGRRGEPVDPNFPRGYYAEHVLEGVLSGSPGEEIEAGRVQLNAGMVTINEYRKMKNRPPVEGGDVPLVNGALVPLHLVGEMGGRSSSSELDSGLGDEDEAPALGSGGGLRGRDAAAAVMSGLGRVGAVAEVDVPRLVEGLSAGNAQLVATAVATAFAAGWTPERLRGEIRRLEFE